MKKILSIFLALALIFSFTGCGKDTIKLTDYSLGSQIPNMDFKDMELNYDFKDSLSVDVLDMSSEEFNKYVNFVSDNEYTIDYKKDENNYSAFNKTGYNIDLSYNSQSEKLTITIKQPLDFTELIWPKSDIAKSIPKPDSNSGLIEWENAKGFVIYVNNINYDKYNVYVEDCFNAGFNLEYSKGKDYFWASNKIGYGVSLRYEGNNTIWIRADVKDKVEDPSVTHPEKPEDSGSDKVNFKEALDSYEKFINEYVEFMKKYNSAEDTSALLADYTKYLNQYTETMNKISKMDTSTMTTDDLAYYMEVTNRINAKLLETMK